MTTKLLILSSAVICLTVAALGAQDSNSGANLIAQLQTQYVLTKLPANGGDITEPGSVLILQKNGLMGGPRIPYANSYKDGRLKQGVWGAFASNMVNSEGQTNRGFQQSDRFYLLKMEAKGDKLNFILCSADLYDGARYYASVSFQFAKGYLASANAASVQITIGELFLVQQNQDAAGQPAASDQPADAAQQQPEPQPQPQSIEAGQTIDQVVAIMGQPEKVLKVGNRQIYVYKDLKITFIDGKVSDVQ